MNEGVRSSNCSAFPNNSFLMVRNAASLIQVLALGLLVLVLGDVVLRVGRRESVVVRHGYASFEYQ